MQSTGFNSEIILVTAYFKGLNEKKKLNALISLRFAKIFEDLLRDSVWDEESVLLAGRLTCISHLKENVKSKCTKII